MNFLNKFLRVSTVSIIAFFSWALLCSHIAFKNIKTPHFESRPIYKKKDLGKFKYILQSKKSFPFLDYKSGNIELALGQGRVDKSIYKAVKRNNMVFIAMSQPKESFRWIGRDVNFVTKPYAIKSKSAPDGSIIGGLVPADQRFSKIAKSKLLNKYQDITDELIKSNQVRTVPVIHNGKIAVARSGFVGVDIIWVDENSVKGSDTIVKVLANEDGEIYVSDVDGLLLASKVGAKSQWDQNVEDDFYGLHAEGHIKFAKEANTLFGQKIINHSFCHSWDLGDCKPSYPLIAYSPSGIHLIERGPKHDRNKNLWSYLIELDKKGYKIRPSCTWQLPAQPETVSHLFKEVSCENNNPFKEVSCRNNNP